MTKFITIFVKNIKSIILIYMFLFLGMIIKSKLGLGIHLTSTNAKSWKSIVTSLPSIAFGTLMITIPVVVIIIITDWKGTED